MAERKPTYEELWRENEMFRFVFDQIHEGVYITDENGVIVEYNASVQETEGFRREDVIYRNEKDVYGHFRVTILSPNMPTRCGRQNSH